MGSVRGSYLVTIEWKGIKNNSKPIAFVGKGVTFDTGGYSLKPARYMEDMTYDMAGSAAAEPAISYVMSSMYLAGFKE